MAQRHNSTLLSAAGVMELLWEVLFASRQGPESSWHCRQGAKLEWKGLGWREEGHFYFIRKGSVANNSPQILPPSLLVLPQSWPRVWLTRLFLLSGLCMSSQGDLEVSTGTPAPHIPTHKAPTDPSQPISAADEDP